METKAALRGARADFEKRKVAGMGQVSSTEIMTFNTKLHHATRSSANAEKHVTNAQLVAKVQSYGRQCTKAALADARNEFESRQQENRGRITSTEIMTFSSSLAEPTKSSSNDTKHETNA